MILTYQELNYAEHVQPVMVLCAEQWKVNHTEKFDPDMPLLYDMFTAGNCKALGGFDSDGNLGTLYMCLLDNYLFSRQHIMATELIWTIRKDLKGLGVLRELLREITKFHRRYNVHLATLALPNDRLTKLVGREGYEEAEVGYIKRYN